MIGKSLADLKVGQQGRINTLHHKQLSIKLMEMGCLPGCTFKVCCKAPFGGPICIALDGTQLSMRLEEAKKVEVY